MSEGTSKGEFPRFPAVVHINGRGYIWRSELEAYKAALVRCALGGRRPPPASRPEHDALIALKIASAELGVGSRTIERRIKDAQNVNAVAG